MNLQSMKQDFAAASKKADAILAAAETAGRDLTDNERVDFDASMAEVQTLTPQIANIERRNTLSALVRTQGPGVLIGAPRNANGEANAAPGVEKKTLSAEYRNDFQAWIASGGNKVGAALYEGSNPAGGFAVPITVDGQIVALAPQETGIRKLAQVIPTSNDLRVPRKAAFGAPSAAKAESGAVQNTFAESGPTLDEFTLSAYMSGAYDRISFELAQDVPAFQSFVIGDLLNGQQQAEEAWYISGTGNGQPQGVIGNTGAGVTEQPDALGNLVTIDGTLDLVGTLNAEYHPNASFLMSRLTSILIRKAQRQSNLFEPVFTRSNGQDYLHGYPVQYSSAMPAAAHGATPIIFGDWTQGYLIGDRGGAGINLKILDQPMALQGQIIILCYRRTDGRVRRSEALQAYTVAAS